MFMGGDLSQERECGRTIAAAPLFATVEKQGLSDEKARTSTGSQAKPGLAGPHRRGPGAAGAAARARRLARPGRRLCLGARAGRADGGRPCRRIEICAAQGDRKPARHTGSPTPGASPTACPPTTRCCGARAAWAKARWSRRCMRRSTRPQSRPLVLIEIHREDIATLPQLLRLLRARQAALPAVLRRSFLRQGRHQLQIAEGGAGRRHRRAAGQCAVLRHLQPPPSDAARPGGQ